MTRKFLPGPMRRAGPVETELKKWDVTPKSTNFAFFIASCIARISNERDCIVQLDMDQNRHAWLTSTNFSTSMESGSTLFGCGCEGFSYVQELSRGFDLLTIGIL